MPSDCFFTLFWDDGHEESAQIQRSADAIPAERLLYFSAKIQNDGDSSRIGFSGTGRLVFLYYANRQLEDDFNQAVAFRGWTLEEFRSALSRTVGARGRKIRLLTSTTEIRSQDFLRLLRNGEFIFWEIP